MYDGRFIAAEVVGHSPNSMTIALTFHDALLPILYVEKFVGRNLSATSNGNEQ